MQDLLSVIPYSIVLAPHTNTSSLLIFYYIILTLSGLITAISTEFKPNLLFSRVSEGAVPVPAYL